MSVTGPARRTFGNARAPAPRTGFLFHELTSGGLLTYRGSVLRVKICGLRSAAVALACATAGADLLGFNFAPVSKRRVAADVATEAIATVRAALGGHAPAMAGIFVNQAPAEVAGLVRRCGLDFVQLSGSENEAYCREVAALTGVPLIKAVRLVGEAAISEAQAFVRAGGVSILLADAAVAGSWGGSGQTWDWSSARDLAGHVPLLLAGGLTAESVEQAIHSVRPWGVDVASGVETAGQTDAARAAAFISAARAAASDTIDRSSIHEADHLVTERDRRT